MAKTALVLTGGVAKGSYESGVLRALSEMEIVPDVIVGISAGAINGAFAANQIAGGRYRPEIFEDGLIRLWTDQASLDNLYNHYSESAQSLSDLFGRLGIDPFKMRYRPRWNLEAFYAFRELVKGNFTSIFTLGLLEQLLKEQLVPPKKVVRPVRYSAGVSNIMGQISLEGETLISDFRHYSDFDWKDGPTPEEWERQFELLHRVIVASSSFPFVFPPQSIELDENRPGLYVDGALLDNFPIDKAIQLDPEVDTIYVVLSATAVSPMEDPPKDFLDLLYRIFTVYAGHYIVTNYQRVLETNRRIEALRKVLDTDFWGRVRQNRKNEQLCLACGFRSLEHFLSKRVLRLVPIFPTPALEGNVFSGFFDRELMVKYTELGYRDGLAAIRMEKRIPQQMNAIRV